jgi:hypothetical protein
MENRKNQSSNGSGRRRLLKLKPASEYSGFSVWRLRQLIWDGVLPIVQLEPNGPYLLDTRDIDRYIESVKHTVS